MIDKGENLEKYTVFFLREMKAEHERSIRELTGLAGQLPKRVIVLKSMIHGQRPAIPLGCYLGYAIGNKLPVQTYQHFRDTEDWKWRDKGEGYTVELPNIGDSCSDVNLFINISGIIDKSLTVADYPVYAINATTRGLIFFNLGIKLKISGDYLGMSLTR